MRVSNKIFALMFSIGLVFSAVQAAEEDYAWTMSGALSGLEEFSTLYVGVTNDTLLTAATLEVHYDTTLLEFAPYTNSMDYLTGKTTVFAAGPTVNAGADFVRVLIFNIDQTAGTYTPIPSGSGNVLKLQFRVKPGVPGGTQTLVTLTRKQARVMLTTQQFEIEGSIWETPGDPKEGTWKMKGLAVADSVTTEVYILLTNPEWLADMVLDLDFDPALLAIAAPASDVTLKGRAADINLAVEHVAGSGTARLTFSKPSSTPPFPYIEPGSGVIAGIKFTVVGTIPSGGSTNLVLSLDDGTELVSFQLESRVYSGPSADVDGNGSTSIFDVLEFLSLWRNSPPSVFTDVNGDGKSDIFDLLEILKAL